MVMEGHTLENMLMIKEKALVTTSGPMARNTLETGLITNKMVPENKLTLTETTKMDFGYKAKESNGLMTKKFRIAILESKTGPTFLS